MMGLTDPVVDKDSDLRDPVSEVDLDISKLPIAWLGSTMPTAFEETAFGLAVDVGNSSSATALFKGLDSTGDFGK